MTSPGQRQPSHRRPSGGSSGGGMSTHHAAHGARPTPSAPVPPTSSSSAPTATNTNPSSESDKFVIFERWLRANGAQFPLLELRKYDAPSKPPLDDEELRRPSTASEENDAEEKKDGGGNLEGGLVREGSEGVAMMSLEAREGAKTSIRGGGMGRDGGKEDDGSGEMRGVHARSPIPPHTVCVSIPRACLITVEMGQNTPVGRKILASDLELDAPKHIFLMVYLLWDRKLHGRASFFAPYYDILPQTLRNMPIFWNEEELRMLEGSHLLVQVADRAEAIREDYESICAIAPEFQEMASLEDFQWARMIVCSRNFGLLINGHRTSALVPHADMLNHYRPRETKWTFCEETQCFTITTLRGIGAGEQVYDSYGQKCNHRFLLNYGFCVERNVEVDGFCPNEVPLEVGMELAPEGRVMFGRGGGGSGGESGEGVDERARELFEKKLAFWSRGDATAAAAAHHLFQDMGASSMAHLAAAGSGGSLGASFQALVAAAAGASSTRGAAPSASTADIARNVASMTDPSATAALAEAIAGISGPSTSSSTLSHNTPPLPSLPSRPTLASCPVKRVRVCASNNENTRTLFSMLRVLACDAGELDRIANHGGRLGGGGGTSGGAAPFYAGGPPTAAQRLLFGASPLGGPSASSSTAGAAAGGSSSLRTCRDVRHPLSLRNERRALALLLEVTARALARYPTSLARDRSDLADERAFPRYSNARNAKLQVRGEKEVLHHFALWARTGMHVVDIIMHEVEAERHRLVGGNRLVRGGNAPSERTAGEGAKGGAASSTPGRNEELGFDYVIQAMEDDEDCHTTILRYCSDVLGAVRREELNRIGSSVLG